MAAIVFDYNDIARRLNRKPLPVEEEEQPVPVQKENGLFQTEGQA